MTTPATFLVTGGNGFIGSHTVVQMYHYLALEYPADFRILILDNNSNSDPSVIRRVHQVIDAPESHTRVTLYPEPVDVCNAG